MQTYLNSKLNSIQELISIKSMRLLKTLVLGSRVVTQRKIVFVWTTTVFLNTFSSYRQMLFRSKRINSTRLKAVELRMVGFRHEMVQSINLQIEIVV